MSYEHRRGYRAERAVEVLLADHGAYRPRAGRHDDVGDIGGVPLVISVKNHRAMELSTWVDEMAAMVARSNLDTGVVWHTRRMKGDPRAWYVTTTGDLFLPLYRAYLDSTTGSSG